LYTKGNVNLASDVDGEALFLRTQSFEQNTPNNPEGNWWGWENDGDGNDFDLQNE